MHLLSFCVVRFSLFFIGDCRWRYGMRRVGNFLIRQFSESKNLPFPQLSPLQDWMAFNNVGSWWGWYKNGYSTCSGNCHRSCYHGTIPRTFPSVRRVVPSQQIPPCGSRGLGPSPVVSFVKLCWFSWSFCLDLWLRVCQVSSGWITRSGSPKSVLVLQGRKVSYQLQVCVLSWCRLLV